MVSRFTEKALRLQLHQYPFMQNHMLDQHEILEIILELLQTFYPRRVLQLVNKGVADCLCRTHRIHLRHKCIQPSHLVCLQSSELVVVVA